MSTQSLPQFTREFVRDNIGANLVIIHNLVFDLSQFFRQHPGGEDILQEYLGLDASEAFEAVGHSNRARTMMLNYLVGEVVPSQQIQHEGNLFDLTAIKSHQVHSITAA
uniref:Cytochrome b5 heme-binding domain-containing protein n=1 Tax=Panagrolaimus sp. JU765 TaxID=591449 RepID=A0AC34QU38_9BILA